MKIVRQILNFIFSITLFLSVTLLTVIFVSKEIGNDGFIAKMVNDQMISNALKDEDIDINEQILIGRGVDFEHHKYIDMTEVSSDYLNRLIQTKTVNPDRFVKISQIKFEKAIEESGLDINYRKTGVSDIEERLDNEFNTFYKSARVRLMLKMGQSDTFLLMMVIMMLISLVSLKLVSKRNLHVAKILLFTLIINIAMYLLSFMVLSIPHYSGKFLAVYLNILLEHTGKLLLTTVSVLSLLVIIVVSSMFMMVRRERKIAKRKGIKTLDNFFDDYDVDLVIEEVKKKEEAKKAKKKKKKENKKEEQ